MLLAISLALNAIIIIAIVLVVRSPKEEQLVALVVGASADSPVTAGQRGVLQRRLQYERRAKLVGGLVGFMLPGFLKAFVELPAAINGFSLGFAGLLIGSVVGAAHETAPSGSRRSARLRERRIEHYVPMTALRWTRALAIAAVVMAALTGPLGRLIDACVHPDMARSAATPAMAACFALVATALVEIGVRRIIGRGQSAAPEGLVAIDDILRTRAVIAATAAGLAAVVLSMTLAASATLTNGPVCGGPGEWTRIALLDIAVAAVGFVTAIGVWISLSRRALSRPADAPTGYDLSR